MSTVWLIQIFQIFTVTAVSATFAYVYATYHYGKWKALGVPHTKPTPLFGHLTDVIRGRTAMVDVIQSLYGRFDGHRFFGMYEARQPALVIREPELVHAIATKNFESFRDRIAENVSFVHDELSEHLINLRGDRWKAIRTKLTPAFTVAKIKSMLGDINECTARLVENINAQTAENGDGIVDVSEVSEKFTIDTIGRCAFGLEFNAVSDSFSELLRIARVIFLPSRRTAIINIIRLAGMSRLLCWFRIRTVPYFVYDFFVKVLNTTMKQHETGEISRNDLVSFMLKLKDEDKSKNNDEKLFNNNVLAANALSFFMAGYETTGSTISYCLYELALNRDIQSKLRLEIQQTLYANGEKISYDGLKDMKYLDMVINETLRLRPPGFLLARVCTKKYKIPNSDIKVNVGEKVFIPIHSIHNDPKYYPNPDVFDPERFTEENKALRPHGTFYPFGEGPRVCIGLRFALMEIKIGLVEILTRFEIMPCKDTKIPIEFKPQAILLTPKDPIRLKFMHIE